MGREFAEFGVNNSVGNSPSSPRGWRERPPCSRPPVRCPSASSGARRDHARISLAAARADCPTCVPRPGSGRATRCWRGCPAVPALRQLSHVVDRRGFQRAIAGTDGDVVGLNAAPGHAQLLQRRRVDECATRRCCLPAVGCLRTYRNDRDQTSRRWVVTTLSGFEVLRAECGPVRAGRAWSGSWVSPPSTASSPVAAVGVSQRRTLFGDGRDILRRE